MSDTGLPNSASTMMTVHVRYFALYREALGRREEAVTVPAGSTPDTVWQHVAGSHPRLAGLRAVTRFARNNDYVDSQIPLTDGDELAFLPPVSGGSAGNSSAELDEEDEQRVFSRYAVVAVPISLEDASSVVGSDADGAVVAFAGVVRETSDTGRTVVALEYEAFEGMAEAKLREVGVEITARWGIERIAIIHRTGYLPVGEVSIVIAVSCPHRKEAFEACAYAIERLKEHVPIWKREVYADGGSAWLGQKS